jgi:hypothetical protein
MLISTRGLWLRGSLYTRWIQHYSRGSAAYLIAVDSWNLHQRSGCG